jgi:hypothetical protein
MKKQTTKQIEHEMQQIEDKADAIRASISVISDEDICLFADWLANNELQSVSEFICDKAYYESLEPETF